MDLLGRAIDIAHPLVEYGLRLEEKKQSLKRSLVQLENMEADTIIELENAKMQHGKKPRNEVQNWLSNVERVKNEVFNIEQEGERGGWSILLGKRVVKKVEEIKELIDQRGRFRGGLVLDDYVINGDALLVPKIAGEMFGTTKDKILECLMNDEVLSIGIYGMGGVGKTTLAMHIHNELLERRSSFQYVYWISTSQDFRINELQNDIAKAIGFDLSNKDDEKRRAAKLTKAMLQRKKMVLILDDLWTSFPLEKAGIPVGRTGCKLVLTTRSLDVCWKMGCQQKFKLEPLTEEESWNLFKEKLGETLPLEFETIAKSIVRECAGLPLGIVTIAGSMRGVGDVREWRNALRELEESRVTSGDMQDELFRVLKFSYNRLADVALRQCFLYCALYPEDYRIERDDLIEYLIVEKVIEGESRQAEFDEGHTMLNRLEKISLLESVKVRGGRGVKMHDLIRDMAIQILEVDDGVMVKAGRQLYEVSNWKNWTKNVTRISFMYSNITEIPFGHSPNCPNLSTLLFRGNKKLSSIGDTFFNQLAELKVLDLSYTGIQELPVFISNLVRLRALLLRRCYRLKFMPSLAKLKSLEKLDMSSTQVEQVPQGIELLSNLRYLDISNANVEEVPTGILPKLSCLQVLIADRVKAEELVPLKKLETLECYFSNIGELNLYTSSTTRSNLSRFYLVIASIKRSEKVLPRALKVIYFDYCSINEGEDMLLLPKDVLQHQNQQHMLKN